MFLLFPQQCRLMIKVGRKVEAFRRTFHPRRSCRVTSSLERAWIWSLSFIFYRLRQRFSLRWVPAPNSPPPRPSVRKHGGPVGSFHWVFPQVGKKSHPEVKQWRSPSFPISQKVEVHDLKNNNNNFVLFSFCCVFPFRLRVFKNRWPGLCCGPLPHGHRSHRQ